MNQHLFGDKLKMSENIYDLLSKERKDMQDQDLVPQWYSTGGFQLFKEKYEYKTEGRSVRGQFERIARTAAKHVKLAEFSEEFAFTKFFELLWNGWLSPSTPVLACDQKFYYLSLLSFFC